MQLRDFATPSAALLASLAALPQLTSAFYLPGVAPTSYKPGDKVPLYVNAIKPIAAPQDALLHSVVSYDYYHPLFKFCRPPEGPQSVGESLGSILFGDRIKTSPFELNMAKDEQCKQLCEVSYDKGQANFVNRRIQQGYSLNWLVDGLPAGQDIVDELTGTDFYSPGFLLGEENQANQLMFHNHYEIQVEYHEVSGNPDQLRVVGVLVRPASLQYGSSTPDCKLDKHEPIVLNEEGDTKVQFTYSVKWEKSTTAWATRWDKYLHVFDPKIHWFSLINSAIIVVFLVLTVMSVLVRALKKDIARYNRLDQINLDDLNGTSVIEDGVQEDSGWKLVHGDVFRTPSHPLLLSVFLGNGAQLFVMTGFTICFALLGFLSPSNRGSLGTIMVLLYTVLGFVGGYTSARVYKALNGEKWKLNIALTPLLVPGIVFSTFFLLDLFLWAKQSSGAVPFTTMLVIVAIWFIISVPLSFAGSWLGFRASAIEPPVRTNQIPRQIPPTTTYLKPIPSMLLVGILPFGAIFVELYFIMSSIWFSKIYYMFGFLFLCYGLMIITCAAVTVLMVYFLLCAENYNWQWRSFLAAGMSAGYIFANAMIYWISKISLGGLAGSILYIGYSALISFLFFILTGSIGFFSSWWFVRKIYSSIKID
ncbi:putative endosomal integral membrane protein [Phaeoacremonium minimum UCRPA7]|uniref:Transmembrane 9 superfamily member n=1 Tax=Phaeoacremonium minimum (strain UCR-PA7) TaxID=1286976 RepID=R8BPB9_PHAM7|nr:putative endosomal integral membrane protein [Phaeoacremonium minimum UCRPA7]EOO01140.1 putative endosomal integral membrane protein [Phaeoacremonium minimum UCRPA7]